MSEKKYILIEQRPKSKGVASKFRHFIAATF